MRLGVEVAGLLRFRRDRQALLCKHGPKLAPLPCGGAFVWAGRLQPTLRLGLKSAGLPSFLALRIGRPCANYETQTEPRFGGTFCTRAGLGRNADTATNAPVPRLSGGLAGPHWRSLCKLNEAMTMTNVSLSAARDKRVKFTPEATEKIKELVAQGASREEIASLLGVTVGSLQVTCSRLGISLRRKILHSGPTPHLRDPKGTVIPVQGSVGVAYEQEQKAAEVLPARSAKISIIMRYRGNEVSTDLPLTSHALGELALIAMLRDLSIPELVGQILAGAIKNDMIKEILRGAT